MSTKAKLTDAYLRSLPLRQGGQEVIWDESTPGFGVKVGARTKSFIVRYRIAGKAREITLGAWPELGLANARQQARKARAGAVNGEDALARRKKREGELALDATFGAVVRRYWTTDARHKQLRKRTDEERLLTNHVMPHWEQEPIADITSANAINLLEAIAKKHPIQANRVLFALRRPFRWAVQMRMIAASPVADLERLTPENRRERTLSDVEIERIWAATEQVGIFGQFVRALFVTGSRRDEVRDSQWAEFDVKAMIWTRPAARMKGKVDHILPLCPMMNGILASVKSREGYIFSTEGGKTRYGAVSKAKAKLDRLSGVTGWTLHDIRRTVRTRLAEIGIPFEIAEKILAHRTDKIEIVYNRHEYVEEKRDALMKWEARLKEIVGSNTL